MCLSQREGIQNWTHIFMFVIVIKYLKKHLLVECFLKERSVIFETLIQRLHCVRNQPGQIVCSLVKRFI